MSLSALGDLSIGRRDAYLLTLRELTFGTQMDSQATCPQCQESLEFTLSTSDLRLIDPSQPDAEVHHWQQDTVQVQFRLPNSLDLAAMVTIQDPALARQTLLERCVLAVNQDGQTGAIATLTEVILVALANHLITVDPQADITLNLSCPACGHAWQVLFDIVAFLWGEITAQAQRLLLDVHQLAQIYHWPESEILAMSSQRRQCYLDLVS
jgi:hypothetical protein